MATTTISLANFAKGLKKGYPQEKLKYAAIRGMREAAAQIEGKVVLTITNWKPYAIVDEGTLRNSVRSFPIDHGARIQAGGGAAGYAAYIEYGTRPHFPPQEPIREWVRRKQITDGTDRAINSMAAAVIKTIGRYGTPPKPFMRRTVKRNLKLIEATVTAAVQKERAEILSARKPRAPKKR